MASRILVAYGTSEGQTAHVAQAIAARLRERGDSTYLADLEEEQPDLAGFDGAAIGGSAHAGHFQAEVREYVEKNADRLNNMPSWFFGVSLSQAGKHYPIDPENAQKQIQALFEETGWRPRAHLSVAGALKYREYNFFKRSMMKHVAANAGEATDTSRDWEYTDWPQVEAFADTISNVMLKSETLRLSTR